MYENGNLSAFIGSRSCCKMPRKDMEQKRKKHSKSGTPEAKSGVVPLSQISDATQQKQVDTLGV